MTLSTYFSTWGWLTGLALLFGIFNWIGVAKREKKVEYVFKPFTMIILLVVAWVMKQDQHNTYMRTWFLPALFLSLCGDVFLMFPDNIFFLTGLISFLIAHVCYILGLNSVSPSAGVWGVVIFVSILLAVVYPKIDHALKQKGEHGLRIPVAVYAVILSIMLGSAWTVIYRPGYSPTSQIVIAMGGMLFFVSDLLLAWNRFIKHSHQRDVVVMVTYQVAQILLTASIALSP
jgi:uncharacterized membrane protein YhhN